MITVKVKHVLLSPCPFCGNHDQSKFSAECDKDFLSLHISCEECGARTKPIWIPDSWNCKKQGRLENTMVRKAVEAWNRRSDQKKAK